MSTIFKHSEIKFEENPTKIEHYKLLTSTPRFSTVVNSKNLIFDIRILNPGQYSFPYHFHRHAEELIMITSGTMTMSALKRF